MGRRRLTDISPDKRGRIDPDQRKLDRDVGDFTPSSGLAVEGIDPESDDSIQRVQVSQVVRAIPLLLLFHACAALSIHNLTSFSDVVWFSKVWHGGVILTALSLGVVFFLWRRGRLHERPEQVLRGLELLCLLLGLVWATPAAVAVYLPDKNVLLPVAGVSLAVMGIVAASLVRVPTGAIVFVALVTAALARALYVSVDSFHVIAALVCAIYGLVLAGIVVNSHFDFLRRSRAEIEVQRQHEVIRLLLNDFERQAQDWLWETDKEGRLSYYSPRFAEVLGVTPERLRAAPLRHVLADHAQNDGWRKLDYAMADEAPVTDLELDLLIAGKPVVWQVTARTMQDRRGRFSGYRGVSRDVTASHEAQRKIERAMIASEKASEAKSQFLAVTSHELRTPISAIVGFAELLAKEKQENLPQKTRIEFADTILDNARQLQDLVNDILDATRLEKGTLHLNEQETDAAALVEFAIKHCQASAETSNISIVGRLGEGVSVKGDTNRLKQVMVNLLNNAIKFSNASGIINVEMQKGRDGQFVLAIKDAGIGIEFHNLERMFEPFEQADTNLARRFGGAGLGLPIARRIARLHGGDVTLESDGGTGTTARLILPKRRVSWPTANADDLKVVA